MADIRVNRILNVTLSAPDAARVLTDRSGTLIVVDSDLRAELTKHAKRGAPVSLDIDPIAGRIEQVSSAPMGAILRLAPDWEGSDDVMMILMQRPSPLFLRRTHPRFTEFKNMLETAFANGEIVALGTRPAGRDIHDVRVQDWE